MQVNIPTPSLSGIVSSVDGYKTYVGVAVSAAVIVANHFGWLPPQYTPSNLDPNNWLWNLAGLYFIATGRSALAKNGSIGALMQALKETRMSLPNDQPKA
jgi:hypothetical protein